jgi:hypothetical protein
VQRSLRDYNLDAILAVGFRVRSHRGTQFRQWATARLSEYLVKGLEDTEPELQVLHRIVGLYIEYAELQAFERRPMTMQDWITKLDEFLKVSGRVMLDHAGSISADAAKQKAELEYARYHALLDAQPRAIDAEFENVAKQLKKPGAARGKNGKRS